MLVRMLRWIRERLSIQLLVVAAVIAIVAIVGLAYRPSNLGWLRSYCTELDAGCPCMVEKDPYKDRSFAACRNPSDLSKEEKEPVYKVVEKRLELYRGELGDLRTNLWLQFAFMVAAFLILLKTNDEPVKIPILDREIDAKWARLVIPLILLYLYIVFGFLFDHLIQERYILWVQLDQLEHPRGGHSIHSLRMLLEDRWVMDSWFAEFHDDAIALPNLSPWGNRFLLTMFGLFIALQHSCALLLLTRKALPGGARAGAGCFATIAVIYGLSHLGFLLMGQNPNWVQVVIAGGVLALLFLVRRENGALRWTLQDVLPRREP
jgi:hypothetical protein